MANHSAPPGKTEGCRSRTSPKVTKIRTDYLVALEGDDFERLPNEVFSRGFVRAYAEVVGLDPETAVAASVVERKASGIEKTEQPKDLLAELDRLIPDKASGAAQRSLRRLLLVGAGALVVVGVISLSSWLLVGRGAPEPIAPTPIAAIREPAPVPVSPPLAASDLPSPTARGERVRAAAAPTIPEPTPVASAPAPRAVGEPLRPAAAPEIRETTSIPTPATPPLVVEGPADPPDQAGTSSLVVPDFAVGRGVANRRVVDPSDSFDEGQTVWFWTHVEGAAPGDRIQHVWLHGGQQVHTIDLGLGGASWRTHSAKKMRPGSRGDWRVEARDAAGRVLAASDFVCR